jgi:hypothetical protein
LHIPWPNEGENGIFGNQDSAVKQLKYLLETNNVPTYVPSFIDRIHKSEGFLANEVDDKDETNLENDDDSSQCHEDNEYDNLYDSEIALNSETNKHNTEVIKFILNTSHLLQLMMFPTSIYTIIF